MEINFRILIVILVNFRNINEKEIMLNFRERKRYEINEDDCNLLRNSSKLKLLVACNHVLHS